MHREAASFCMAMKAIFPKYFRYPSVLDIGASDLNGNNKYLFNTSSYTATDIWPGPGVDLVCNGADIKGRWYFVICTEVLEHAENWQRVVQNALNVLDRKGALLITCAGPARAEHGTRATTPADSPCTQDYYRNVSATELAKVLHGAVPRHEWGLVMEGREGQDTYAIVFPETPTPHFRWALMRYIWLEIKLFGLQRVQRWKRFFKRLPSLPQRLRLQLSRG